MRYIIILFLSFLLTACSYIHGYHPDFQQGNIIHPQRLNRLHLGMSRFDVEHLMGAPVLQNSFDNNRLLYVYTFKSNNGPMVIKQVALTFKNNRLVHIEKNLDYHPTKKRI